MKRPDMKPVWSSLITEGKTVFNLFATIDEKKLYMEFNKVRGRQFFDELRNFSCLGMHVITPSKDNCEHLPPH